MPKSKPLRAVDLFAGAGGLSLGARRAGFQVPVAVEIDKRITPTYRKNHPDAVVLEKDVRQLTGAELARAVPGGHIDLLMGCAPCQGFCSLTIKNELKDPRNGLVKEMARLVEETLPTAVVMENVSGLALRGGRLLSAFIRRLKKTGYVTAWWNVQMADHGVPQNRRRLVLLAGRGFAIDLPAPTHARIAGGGRRRWRTLHQAIYGEKAPKRLGITPARAANWHVVRDLLPETRARLQAALPGRMRLELDDALLPECHQEGYDGFRNVYMRMAWDAPSPTITGGCTTPAKGRFGHPDRRRTTISVREAATIQTFPKSFRFDTDKIDLVCEMIGNAVPPLFAERLASTVLAAILKHRAQERKK
ncbi:MAG TPA: DNA cytosine methyltransferase [Vicinamibacterales bacterium]|jgi:DNA (cytosine-5)-methyltransferase 1